MSYASEVLADSPAAYYRCQEASGLIQDSSGNGRNADTAFGVAVYQQSSPITSDPSDFSILFDGDSAFNVPDSAGLDLGDIFTLEFWVKLNCTPRTTGSSIKGGNGIAATSAYAVLDRRRRRGSRRLSHATVADVVTTTTPALGQELESFRDHQERRDGQAVFRRGRCHRHRHQLHIRQHHHDLKIGTTDATWMRSRTRMDEIALYPTALSQARVLAHYEAATETGAGPGDNPPIGILGRGAGW